jgi:hypothetical protein
MVKEVRINGIDRTDEPIPFGTTGQSLADVEVVLTDRVSEIAGTVADDRARPVPAAPVVVFSTDRSRWYDLSRFLRRTQSDDNGTFSVAGLPYGSYFAVALPALPADGPDAWQDPAFLESIIPAASTVTLGDGQTTTVSLRARTLR